MNIMNIRKYIFFNLLALGSYFFTWDLIKYKITDFPPCPPEAAICSDSLYLTGLALFFLVLLCSFLIGIIEVLVRKLTKKFIIEKYFPNFKPDINIKIPKFIVILYNILFLVGFSLGSIYILAILLFIVVISLIGTIF